MRTPPEKPIFTFSNGATVTLERVGPLFALPIQQANPTPEPPLAPGVGGQMEPNPSDPDYAKALEAHQLKVQLIMNDTLLDLGISDDIVIDQEKVDRYRHKMARYGTPLADDDRMVYIKYLCLTSDEDFRIYQAIREYDAPDEEDIRTAGAMFSGDSGREPAGDSAPVATQKQDPV